MINLLRLVLRRWQVDWKLHLAAAIVSAAVLTGWLLLWGYVEATGQAAAEKVAVPPQLADLVLVAPLGSKTIDLPTYLSEAYQFATIPVATSVGNISLGAVSLRHPSMSLPQPVADRLWVSRDLAERWQLQVGDDFPLRLRKGWGFQRLVTRIAGVYEQSAFLPDLLADSSWLTRQVALPTQETVLVNRKTGNQAAIDSHYNAWLKQLPESIKIVDGNSLVGAARQIADDTLRNGGSVIALLCLFLILGLGTFSMLSYLDGRRELAVLKSLGLRPGEALALFYLESLITVPVSWLLGIGVANLLGSSLGLPIRLEASIYGQSLLWLLIATTLGSAVPCLLAQKTGSIDLMFSRPVPLLRSGVSGLTRRHAGLEAWLEAGYSCIKLPNTDGHFPGICLRQEGAAVKQGEMLAWESHAFGLAERHYLSPCDGRLVRCDLRQGLLVIAEQPPSVQESACRQSTSC